MEITNFYCAIEKIPFTPKCLKQCDNCNVAESLPKQETLEEAAEKYSIGKSSSSVFQEAHAKDFINGAKWQAKRMYSEEEVLELLQDFANDLSDNVINIKFWFEQNKKK